MIVPMLFVNQINAQKIATDWQKNFLKGKVRQIIEIGERCPTVMAEGGSFNCPKDTTRYEFNEKGFTPKTSDAEKIIEKKTLNGFYYITTYKTVEGAKRKEWEEVYDAKNLLVKHTMYSTRDADEDISNQWEYFYDKSGTKIKQNDSEWWNKQKTMIVRTYNNYGDEVKRQTFKNDNLNDEEQFQYNYTKDQIGNWVKKTVSGGHYNETWTRKIIYYKS